MTVKKSFHWRGFLKIKNKKYKILITLLEEFDNDEEIRNFTSQEDAFSFWNNDKENIYQDYILRDKK